MVRAALAAGQADQLSDHPTTQGVLGQLREGDVDQANDTQGKNQKL
jgi:hypothetical protein